MPLNLRALLSSYFNHTFISLLFPWTVAWNSSLFNMVSPFLLSFITLTLCQRPWKFFPISSLVCCKVEATSAICALIFIGARSRAEPPPPPFLFSFIPFHVCCLFFSSPDWVTSGLMKLTDRNASVGIPNRSVLAEEGSRQQGRCCQWDESCWIKECSVTARYWVDLFSRHFPDYYLQLEKSEEVFCGTGDPACNGTEHFVTFRHSAVGYEYLGFLWSIQ